MRSLRFRPHMRVAPLVLLIAVGLLLSGCYYHGYGPRPHLYGHGGYGYGYGPKYGYAPRHGHGPKYGYGYGMH